MLAELQELSDGVAPDAVHVGGAPGSLQVALLESMGAAVAEMAGDAEVLLALDDHDAWMERGGWRSVNPAWLRDGELRISARPD